MVEKKKEVVENVNPFLLRFKGEGGIKIFEEELNTTINTIEKKKLLLNFDYSNVSVKGYKVLVAILENLTDCFSTGHLLTLSPTEINKKLKYKTVTNVRDGLIELERVGVIKLKDKGNVNRKPYYYINVFKVFIGTTDQFKNYIKHDVKILFPKLYIKMYL